MKINIIKKNPGCIMFSSLVGSGAAIWCGDDVNISGAYDVEIDFDSEYTWGDDIFYSSNISETIAFCEGVNKINAKVISTDGSVVAISFGGDVILIEVSGADRISSDFYICFYSPVERTKITPFLI